MFAWFAEATIVAAALAALAAIATRSARLGAAGRHLLWLVVLLKLVSPPLIRLPIANVSLARVPSLTARSEPEPEPCTPALLPLEIAGFDGPIPEIPGEEAAIDQVTEVIADPPPLEMTDAPDSVPLASIEPVEVSGVTTVDPPAGGDWTGLLEFAQRWAMRSFVLGSMVYLAIQAWRIARFRDVVRRSKPVPEWLDDLIIDQASRFGVSPPLAVLIDGMGSPFLWCGGRTVLIVPSGMLGRLEARHWEGVVAHELAHLKRLDPWVSRVTLAAGILWWWNPLYWLVRGRLEAEAELACDALSASARPEGRRRFAESLVAVCEVMSARPAPPALGVGGEGRFLERRLRMILHGRDSGRLPLRGALAAALLTAMAVPSWSAAQDAPRAEPPPQPPAAPAPPEPPAPPEAPLPPVAPSAPGGLPIEAPGLPPIPPTPPRTDVRPGSADDLEPARARETARRDAAEGADTVQGERAARTDDEEPRDGEKATKDADEARARISAANKELHEELRKLQKEHAETMARIARLQSEIAKNQAEIARDQRREARRAGAARSPRALAPPRVAPDGRPSDLPPVEVRIAPPPRPERGPAMPRIRSLPGEGNEVERLNRRMDAMEQKLDRLLEKLDAKPGASHDPEPVRASRPLRASAAPRAATGFHPVSDVAFPILSDLLPAADLLPNQPTVSPTPF